MPAPLLTVSDLAVERGGRLVLSRLSFAVRSSEIVLVTGANGSGKSTLLRTIAGLLTPVSGRVEFGLSSHEVRGPETAHYLGYDDALKPSLTVRENLAFWAALLLAPVSWPQPLLARSVPDALDRFGIARLADIRAGYLSAGQKRRVALARMLLAPRPVWLLDEPLIALDLESQATLSAVMTAHRDAGGAILLASHQPVASTSREIALDPSPIAPDPSPTATDPSPPDQSPATPL